MNPEKIYDYIIIGQGLAGTLLTWFLQRESKTCFVFDAEKDTASFVAAGIINPVTGRNFVKSWMIDTFLPCARNTYQEMEDHFGLKFYHELDILRSLHTVKEENDWMARMQDPAYSDYVGSIEASAILGGLVRNDVSYGRIKQAARVDLRSLISAMRNQLKSEGRYQPKRINFGELTAGKDHLEVGGIKAKAIIFCEGFQAINNPAFHFIPFAPAKGNVMLIKASWHLTYNLRDEMFVTPVEEANYWVGSGYRWDRFDSEIDETDQQKLDEFASAFLAEPYEVVHRMAGVRPALKSRRPVMGALPGHTGVYIFNGLGTKGTSMGPYFARQLADHLLYGMPIMAEAGIMRF
ncbi:MAG: FAD-binding oxidoreductase [Saprospiraceae bacterium]|nr:FAD-binding oxidoreductase [Saprospiraceae bacterium]